MVRADQAIVDQLCSIRNLLEAAEDRVIDVFFVTLPEAGGTRTFYTGITRIDYAAGTIINPDGSVDQISRKLDDVQNKSVMHSISIYAEDAAIIFALDGSGKQTVQQQFLFQLPYVTFTKIQITCTEDTEVNLFACTNPQATLGNFRLTQITDITQPYIVADDPELTTWAATLVSLSDNMSRIRNQIISITGESWGTVSNSIASILSTISGHDHDGTDSKKVTAANVLVVDAGGKITAADVEGALVENRTALDVDEADMVTHKADTSTHGVSEVADAANYETGADITDEENIASSIVGVDGKSTPHNNDTIPIIDSEASNVLKELTWTNVKATLKTYFDTLYDVAGGLTTHEADTSTHGVAEVADAADFETGADVTDSVNIASSIVGTDAKATPVDADTMPLIDSADASSLKEVLWSQVKATLKTYFDTLYDVAGGLTTHEADTSTHGVAEVADAADFETGADVTDSVNIASSIVGTDAKATPVDADTMPLIDSADASSLKEVLWSQIKATLKTYFDTLYTDDQTGAEIKTAYEGEAETNAFTDAEKTKLGTVDTNADVTGLNPPQDHALDFHTTCILSELSGLITDDSVVGLTAAQTLTNKSVELDDTLSGDHTYEGITIDDTVGETVGFGDVLYMKSDGKWWKSSTAVADSAEFPVAAMAVATIVADAAGKLLLVGTVYDATFNFTTLGPVYCGTDVPTSAIPSSSGYTVQIIGTSLDTSRMIFNPDPTYIELA